VSLSPARGEECALGGKHLVQPRSEGEDIRPWIKELKTAVAERVISAEIRAAIGRVQPAESWKRGADQSDLRFRHNTHSKLWAADHRHRGATDSVSLDFEF
jgi:hypothetical protein